MKIRHGLVIAGLCMIAFSCLAKDRTTVKSIINGMVKIPDREFWLSETELTQGQWRAVMGDNPSEHKGSNMPVECVSKNDADAFITKLNERAEVKSSRFEFALPTSDEWRYAVNAHGPSMEEQAWTKENSCGTTHEVATKSPNAFGIYDMHGNVWEWMSQRDGKGRGARFGRSFCEAAGEGTFCWYTPSGRRYGSCGLRVAAHLRKSASETAETKPSGVSNETSDGKSISGLVEGTFGAAANFPVPDKAACEKAAKVVSEICAEDYKAVQSGKISALDFSGKLLSYATMTDDAAIKFVLCQNAFEQLVGGDELQKAWDMLDDVMKNCGARYALSMTDKAMKSIRSKMKSRKTSKLAGKLHARISKMKQCIEAIDAADKGLLATPSNNALKQQKASNCIKIGDWPLALALYAEEKDGKRGEIARWELADPETRPDKLSEEAVGDYWWSVAEGMKDHDLLYESVSQHAVCWYQKALEANDLSELKILLLKKRISIVLESDDASSQNENLKTSRSGEPAQGKGNGTSAIGTGPVTLLPTAEGGGANCRYTLQVPMGSWREKWFDDSRWVSGHTEINRGTWHGSDIWIRSYFNCPIDSKKIKNLVLRYHVDDDIEVWLNGKAIYQHKGVHSEYWDIPIEIPGYLIKQKKNVLCIHAHDGRGDRFVDFGLTAILTDNQ